MFRVHGTVLGLGLRLLSACFLDGLQETRVDRLLVGANTTGAHLLLLLLLDTEAEVEIKLLLGGINDLILLRQKLLQDSMGELLTFKSLSELLSAILAESDRLVAAGSLDVIFAEHVAGLVKVLGVGLEGSLQVVDLLVDETELKE